MNHKEREQTYHSMLHTNLVLLLHHYPARSDFYLHFKRGMFIKSNQPGFQQVVYFLLSIIEPQISQYITTWPVRGVREESKFRSEIQKLIAAVHQKYSDHRLPTLLTSHLVTPGGYKFSHYMFKLSNLAMYVHLENSQFVDLMKPLKMSQTPWVHTARLNGLTKVTDRIHKDIADSLMVLEEDRVFYEKEMERLSQETETAKRKIYELTKNGVRPMAPFSRLRVEEYKQSCSNKTYDEWLISGALDKLNELKICKEKYEQVAGLVECVATCNESAMIWDKSTAPEILQDLGDKANLLHYFNKLLAFVKQQLIVVEPLGDGFVSREYEIIEAHGDQLEKLKKHQTKNIEKINKTIDEFVNSEIANFGLDN